MAMLVLAAALPVSLVYAQTHTVQTGDTLSTIAESTASAPRAGGANGISDPDRIYAGQVLTVGDGGPAVAPPTERVHIVVAGETLSSIAEDYGFTLAELLDLNGLEDANYIYEGQALSLPVSHYAPAPVSRAETEWILRAAAQFGRPVDHPGTGLAGKRLELPMTSHVGAGGVMQLMGRRRNGD
jgi:LysM repeat protein